MNKTIGKYIANPIQREQFIKDNADNVEEKGYMKPYTPEQLQGLKEDLANISIEISELEVETFAKIDGRNVAFTLLSPGAEETIESLRDKAIDEQLTAIRGIAPDIAIFEV